MISPRLVDAMRAQWALSDPSTRGQEPKDASRIRDYMEASLPKNVGALDIPLLARLTCWGIASSVGILRREILPLAAMDISWAEGLTLRSKKTTIESDANVEGLTLLMKEESK